MYTDLNMQSSMVQFIFSDLDWKYPFGANLVQKFKIVSLSWNLVSRLIWICRIQWCCSLFMFFTGNTFLGANFILEAEVSYLRNFKYAEFISWSLFSKFDQIYSFWVNLLQKIKIVSLSSNVVPWLIQICRIY